MAVSGFRIARAMPGRLYYIAQYNRQMVVRNSFTFDEDWLDETPIVIQDATSIPTAYVTNLLHRIYCADSANDSKVVLSAWIEGSESEGTYISGAPASPKANDPQFTEGGGWRALAEGQIITQDGSIHIATISDSAFAAYDFLSPRIRLEAGSWTGSVRIIHEVWVDAVTWVVPANTYIPPDSSLNTALGDLVHDLTTEREF